eukprot:gnl/TRDRNA2_/TRDRNA2_155207_c0_seq2.p1 gnl/TRDRNA2_/TRDRNA2_155207_c0~~gnl/TRDRNA2_/TRDRNA2_155207_c0_seq2.p1  ORF type:complete len:151 (+),score=21.90 gnl/TRDRNA2_/TRDRNA2_155207_c0_seq2:2-454(+)
MGPRSTGTRSPPSKGYRSRTLKDMWESHLSAFRARDIDRMLLDYTNRSEIKLYDYGAAKLQTYKGLEDVRRCFAALFSSLTDLTTFSTPVVKIDQKPNSIFVVWKCPGSGYRHATDTFVLDEEFRVVRQNLVVDYQVDKDGAVVEYVKDP